MRRTCPVCGKIFSPKHLNQKYCLPECANAKRKTPILKQCAYCGKNFYTTSGYKIYCCTECREEAMQMARGSICWLCQNYAGKCSWSKSFVPVEGWVAKPVKVDSPIQSYKVKQCPEFVRDIPRW